MARFHIEGPTAKSLPVGVRGMGPCNHAGISGLDQGLPHCHRITGMSAAGDVAAGHQPHQGAIETIPLSQVSIQVYSSCHDYPSHSGRRIRSTSQIL